MNEEISEYEDELKQNEKTEKSDETEKTNEEDKNKIATEQKDGQENKGKKTTSEPDSAGEEGIESSETAGDDSKKTEKGITEKDLDDEWKRKMEEAVLKLRSSLKEKLVKLGIKPEGKV